MSTADILDGEDLEPEVKARAEKLAEEDPQLDMLTAIDRAGAELAEEKRRAEEAARAKVKAKVRHRSVEVDPFDVLGVRPSGDDGFPASERQADYLRKHGIDVASIGMRSASRLIDAIKKRRDAGLCTVKQARALAKRGLDPNVSFERAREILDGLAANGWVVEPWMHEQEERRGA